MNGRPLALGSLIVLATACHDWSRDPSRLDTRDTDPKSSDTGTVDTDPKSSDTGTVDTDQSSDTGAGPAGTGDTGTANMGDTGTVDTATVDIGIEWATISAGSFWMGTPDGICPTDYPDGTDCASELGRSDGEELHYVTLTYAFDLMWTEVTQAQFTALMGYYPAAASDCGTCPVESVNWFEALAFANALSVRDGRAQCYDCTGTGPSVRCDRNKMYAAPHKCPGYRLPTESEWEYAARAGTLTAFYNGGSTKIGCSPLDPNLDAIGWYCGNSNATTHIVALKTPNAWGLYDMSGNVSEWTWDPFGTYPTGNTISPVVDPGNFDTGTFRVCRGGHMLANAKYARSGSRLNCAPDLRDKYLGFRLARSVF